MTTRAAVYLRISNDPEGTRAGIDRQRAECLDLINRRGYVLVETYTDDDCSAWSGRRRPDFERLLVESRERKFEVVVIWAADRLYRKMKDLVLIAEQLAEYVTIETVVDGDIDLTTADGLLSANIKGAVAQHSSDRSSERIRSAKKHLAHQGRTASGRRQFGWQWVEPCPGGESCEHKERCEVGQNSRSRLGVRSGLEPHPIEGPILADLIEKVANREMSLLGATRWLINNGFTGTRGAFMTPTNFRKVMLSPRNVGKVVYKGKIVGSDINGHKIVEQEVFDRLETLLKDPARRPVSVGPPAKSLLGGIVRCGECKKNCASIRRNDRCVASHYVCNGGTACVRRRMPLVDPVVISTIEKWLINHAQEIREHAPPQDESSTAMKFYREIEKLEHRISTLKNLTAKGDLEPEDYTDIVANIRADINVARKQAAAIDRRTATAALIASSEDVGAAWRKLCESDDLEQARAVLKEIVEEILILKSAVPYHPTKSDLVVRLKTYKSPNFS